ncbi:putative duf2418 domain containing protein [Erysiphe necator]|uniref:Putative duf2418 domain containing protein n=1 Tax=Uncinula necator TaxID=52586 RepID=A0A0B1P0J8_UNCNE|nr:putative duf2418 domain containing protein [Erysiphe necator]
MPNLLNGRSLFHLINDCLQIVLNRLRISEIRGISDWGTSKNGNIAALMSHFLYLIALTNLKSSKEIQSLVFTINHPEYKLLNYTALLIINILPAFSILNTIYTFGRKKNSCLFRNSIHAAQDTSSSQSVKISSIRGSPLGFDNIFNHYRRLNHKSRIDQGSLHSTSEIAVWDPILPCLRIFCLFSPGHVIIYWLFFPQNAPDTQPALDILKVIFLQLLMSLQLFLLEIHYIQRAKDISIIHGNVMNEYNVKFVYPRLNPTVRDSGTQSTRIITSAALSLDENVDTFKTSSMYHESPTISQYLEFENISPLTSQQYLRLAVSQSSPSEIETISSYSYHSPIKDPIIKQSMVDISNDFELSPSNILSPQSHDNYPIFSVDSYQEHKKDTFSRRKYERGPSFFR